ncbi:conserved hypothetical protein [Uncinocarpus reesii 1704]|uniref:Agmatinase n=1 Tax=Uncinocarpus reesii (strain UAMH 1704) TaxID=336963 RepID=C4JXV5_UNCRE|nr:uncharacterized protein UREG_07893 [Uncinocarpus reesii 1704]EEP83028.1 conserved hypothetical protein [Uncinocarpus reesii 1704]
MIWVLVAFFNVLIAADSQDGRYTQHLLEGSLDDKASKWGFDWAFSGISSFGHLPYHRCLTGTDELFDVGIIGIPFDSAVTYRPGARLGPRAIREASARHLPSRGFNVHGGVNPYRSWARILDCGDIPVTPLDNDVASRMMYEGLYELGNRPSANSLYGDKPKLILLGGDHSIALPALRALKEIHNKPLALVHFDAHLDTLHPSAYPSIWGSNQAAFNHGSMFWIASQEGILSNSSNVHAGLRTRLTGDDWSDFENDDKQGFLRISTDDIDDIGADGIIKRIYERVGGEIPVYLSIDIDVLDPAFAPGTGAPESGGWSSRELLRIITGLRNLNIVGADIVEDRCNEMGNIIFGMLIDSQPQAFDPIRVYARMEAQSSTFDWHDPNGQPGCSVKVAGSTHKGLLSEAAGGQGRHGGI